MRVRQVTKDARVNQSVTPPTALHGDPATAAVVADPSFVLPLQVWFDTACHVYFHQGTIASDMASGSAEDPYRLRAASDLWSAAGQLAEERRRRREEQQAAALAAEREERRREEERTRKRTAERVQRLSVELDQWAEAERQDEVRRKQQLKQDRDNAPTSKSTAADKSATGAEPPLERPTRNPCPPTAPNTVTVRNNSRENAVAAPKKELPLHDDSRERMPSKGRFDAAASTSLPVPGTVLDVDPPPTVDGLHLPAIPDIQQSTQVKYLVGESATSFRQKAFGDAARYLTDALESTLPTAAMCRAVLLGNRSLCQLYLGNVNRALADAMEALRLKPKYAAAAWRAARALLFGGNIDRALKVLEDIGPCGPMPPDFVSLYKRYAQYHRSLQAGRYSDALAQISAVCSVVTSESPGATTFVMELRRVQCLAELSPDESLEEVAALCETAPHVAALWTLRGMLTYRAHTSASGIREAADWLHRASKLGDAEGEKAAQAISVIATHVSALETAAAARKWSVVLQHVNSIMQVDLLGHVRLRAMCLLQRATGFFESGNFRSALDACNDASLTMIATESAESMSEVLALRAEVHGKLEMWTAAVADALEVARLQPSESAFDRLERLRAAEAFAARASQESTRAGAAPRVPRPQTAGPGPRPPPFSRPSAHTTSTHPQTRAATLYDALGVSVGADVKTIARAYRDAALKWHPDRWVSKGAAARLEAEERFKTLNHAYSTLADAGSRRQYDASLSSNA